MNPTQAEFNAWAKKNDIELLDEFEGFKPGDIVTFTNDYGVKFKNRVIMGIRKTETKFGGRFHLNADTPWWFPINIKNIKIPVSR